MQGLDRSGATFGTIQPLTAPVRIGTIVPQPALSAGFSEDAARLLGSRNGAHQEFGERLLLAGLCPMRSASDDFRALIQARACSSSLTWNASISAFVKSRAKCIEARIQPASATTAARLIFRATATPSVMSIVAGVSSPCARKSPRRHSTRGAEFHANLAMPVRPHASHHPA